MRDLDIAFSSCPNDTFLLHAMLTGRVSNRGIRWRPQIGDVEALNQAAAQSKWAVSKLSFHAFMKLRSRYELLDTGAAFGFGCGPLLVAAKPVRDLAEVRIAIPGVHTTAWMLLQLWNPGISRVVPMRRRPTRLSPTHTSGCMSTSSHTRWETQERRPSAVLRTVCHA